MLEPSGDRRQTPYFILGQARLEQDFACVLAQRGRGAPDGGGGAVEDGWSAAARCRAPSVGCMRVLEQADGAAAADAPGSSYERVEAGGRAVEVVAQREPFVGVRRVARTSPRQVAIERLDVVGCASFAGSARS